MWDIVICDYDLADAREIGRMLEHLLVQQPHRLHLFTKGQPLLDEITDRRIEPAMVILNTQLGEESGIRLAADIQRLCHCCQIIFMSASNLYPEGIYDVDHIYFLLKPVDRHALEKAVNLGFRHLSLMKPECLYIRNKSGDFVVPMDEICSLEKEKRKIMVRTVKGEVCSFYGKFEEIEDQLKSTFIRCHHSFIVNLYRVKSMGKDFFILWDDRKIPISRTYIKQARQQFADYAGEAYDKRRIQ